MWVCEVINFFPSMSFDATASQKKKNIVELHLTRNTKKNNQFSVLINICWLSTRKCLSLTLIYSFQPCIGDIGEVKRFAIFAQETRVQKTINRHVIWYFIKCDAENHIVINWILQFPSCFRRLMLCYIVNAIDLYCRRNARKIQQNKIAHFWWHRRPLHFKR